jgi:hypothetical protein
MSVRLMQLADFAEVHHRLHGIEGVVGMTRLPSDGIATGQITSTADGVIHWVGAEAPAGIAGLPEDSIGGRSLRQTQSFASSPPMRRCRSP